MSTNFTKEGPTVLTVLGATGDLARKKIFPSLFQLHEKGELPELFSVIGLSRRDWGDKSFREWVREVLKEHGETIKETDPFLERISYHKVDLENLQGYKSLAEVLGRIDRKWKTCANKLFYLAVPPKFYKEVFKKLAESGLTEPCSPEEGWTRVIVEKPFGRDLKTAQELDKLLGKLFKEEQIYRIDHYLGKEMFQNILAFRFSNNIFEHSWNNKEIEKIEVKLLEEGGVEERGAFYDGVGALRDVGQNHLLQMLALTTMENPGMFEAGAIRRKREELLETLRQLDEKEVKAFSFRGQYEGYKKIKGVEKDSETETYFKVKGFLKHPRWSGVEITFESGKRMAEQKKEVVVNFKHPTPCLCPPGAPHEYHNKVIFALEPEEEITISVWTKVPGFGMKVEKRSFDLPYRKDTKKTQYTEEYEKLLLDCIKGDQTLFISTKEVEAMWSWADPVISAWEKGAVPLEEYKQGSSEVREMAEESMETPLRTRLRGAREIGIVGLGKMGSNLSQQLIEKGWRVVGYNKTPEATKKLENEGLEGAYSLKEVCEKLAKPRVVWLMIPAGRPVEETVDKLAGILDEGDIVVDGGNSFYKDSKKHYKKLEEKGIKFVDVGVSGGPDGARKGASLMVGGDEELYDYLLPLYIDLSVPEGHAFIKGKGAGHFVKMVHNAIEYGMMQAIAEGFDIMKSEDYKLHLKDIARVYNHGSVIEGKLIGWMAEAFEIFGEDLKKVSGRAGSGGAAGMEKSEAKWTLDIAEKLGVEVKVVEDAIKARLKSQKKPNFQGKIINALRNRFGGHKVKKD